jgi:hypothetical protein
LWTVQFKYFLTTWKKVMGKQQRNHMHPVCQLHDSTAFISTTWGLMRKFVLDYSSTTLSVLLPGWNLVILCCSHGSKNKIIFVNKCPYVQIYRQKKLKQFKFNHRSLVTAQVTRIQQGLWRRKEWLHKYVR